MMMILKMMTGICIGRWKFVFITEDPLGPLKPRKCSAILLVGYSFWYTTAMLVTQVTVFVQHRNPGNACYCYWYNTAVLVTQSQMELYSVMYQGLANHDVKPLWSRIGLLSRILESLIGNHIRCFRFYPIFSDFFRFLDFSQLLDF